MVCSVAILQFLSLAQEEKSAVNTRSTRTTKNMETTTARWSERPTCSAPAPVEAPHAPYRRNRHAEHHALVKPVAMSRKKSASETRGCRSRM